MKFTLAFTLGVIAVNAAPTAVNRREASPEPMAFPEAITAAIADPECWKVGKPCGIGKRSALPDPEADAFAEAVAEAVADPRCWMIGQPCGFRKRETLPEPEAVAAAVADPRCFMIGQPCGF